MDRGQGSVMVPAWMGSSGTDMVAGAHTSVQCCSQRGAVDVDWTVSPLPPVWASTLGKVRDTLESPPHHQFGLNPISSQYAEQVN